MEAVIKVGLQGKPELQAVVAAAVPQVMTHLHLPEEQQHKAQLVAQQCITPLGAPVPKATALLIAVAVAAVAVKQVLLVQHLAMEATDLQVLLPDLL